MKIGFIGLGKMGGNMVKRLLQNNHEIVVFDFSVEAMDEVKEYGAIPSKNIEELCEKLPKKKVIWLMIPAGKTVDNTLEMLSKKLLPGDIIIDGGNSFWKDTKRRSTTMKEYGIDFIDCGTSGGVWGLQNGYCLMYGGDKNACEYTESLYKDLATENGSLYCGKSGSGHFIKMVHNGIEYGMMQALAEGFELIEKSSFDTNLTDVAHVWQHGSVVRSWLLDLTHNALQEDTKLEKIKGYVNDNGEARWMIESGMDFEVPLHVTAASLFTRFESRQTDSFAMKMLAAMRNQFGGHDVKEK
ncbi:MAG: decarboxylating 6-phosphogluconate dehydrogenase [Bacteroidales bacterium]|jgi:6-phosphogluconate dehydrogenase|nr:decarboxylating 6-phosphogluconate dehydrogenase [Bacteroidales bacterium]